MIWHLVQIASRIPRPSGKIPSSNPHLKPNIARTWEARLDIDRYIMLSLQSSILINFVIDLAKFNVVC